MNVAIILQQKGHDVVTVEPETRIGDVAKTLAEKGIGAVLVQGPGGQVAGILSERDIVRGLAECGNDCLERTASEFMSSTVVTCAPEDGINAVMAMMSSRRFRHLPVMKDGQLNGIISIGDVVKRRIDQIEFEAKAMHDYITQGG